MKASEEEHQEGEYSRGELLFANLRPGSKGLLKKELVLMQYILYNGGPKFIVDWSEILAGPTVSTSVTWAVNSESCYYALCMYEVNTGWSIKKVIFKRLFQGLKFAKINVKLVDLK